MGRIDTGDRAGIAALSAKITQLPTAFTPQPDECQGAADALRALIERIELTPGAKRGQVNAMFYGKFGQCDASVDTKKPRLSICHETIYQYVYGGEGRDQRLCPFLPRARRSRRRRYAR